MRIILIRHGDPDYVNDSLTEKGRREAKLLSERISNWNITDFYCSPLGRAKATASYSLEKCNRTATTLYWAREFSYFIDDPVTGRHGVPWDFVPSYWSSEPLMYEQDNWVHADVMKQNPDIAPNYQKVCHGLDKLLFQYGYVRENNIYRVPDKKEVYITSTIDPGDVSTSAINKTSDEEPTIVIFCHLGVICVMLSHLLNIPFPLLVHGFFLPTTSVTVLASEERWSNEAYFRVQTMGDVHHLLSGGEAVSSAGYFTDVFQG